MALPKVTYGTYNYGEYARPSAIKYKGGLGEGIAAGLAKGASSYIQAKEEKKQFTKKVDTETVVQRARFGDELDVAAGSKFAKGENKAFIKKMKEDYGNNYRQWRLGNISAEKYDEVRSGLMGDLRSIAGVKNQALGSLKIDFNQDDVRNTTEDLLASERREGFGKGLYLLGRDEKGNMTYTVETSGGTKTYEGVKILNNKKFFLPSLKYDNSTNKSFNVAHANLLNNLVKGKPEYHKKTLKGEYIYDTIDFEKNKEQIKSTLMSTPSFTNILNDKTFDAKAYYEDSMNGANQKSNLDNGNIYTGTEEQKEQIRLSLADAVIERASINNVSFNKRAIPASPVEKINSATTAINNSALNPVNFYNSQIYQSPHLEDGAELTNTPGVIKLKTYSKDGTSLIPTTMDLRKEAVFIEYIGYIGKNHPSVDGKSKEVRDALSNINYKELHKKYLESIKSEDNKNTEGLDLSNMEIPVDPLFTAPTISKSENNDFSQQK